jgi:lipid II:glycine glycyltransferase (peptidoglycan interpeptide bridge formation enzyme)
MSLVMMAHPEEGWNEVVAGLPGAHLLQTNEWAQVKQPLGWAAQRFVWRQGERVRAAVLLLRRSVPLGWGMLYAPRGPLLDWMDVALRKQVLDDLQSLAHQQRAIFLKLDPEVWLGQGIDDGLVGLSEGMAVRAELERRSWRFSSVQIQFRNTVLLDLQGDEETWLARMKQKARYNLRLAQRKGVTVRIGSEDDFGLLYRLYAQTAVRDGFVIRSEAYYRQVWALFMGREMALPLIAEVDGQAVAAVWLFWFAGRAWYLYGMSTAEHRDKMPNYLLQWEAMRLARSHGCTSYDLWGAPDVFDESDSMWGVFRFKEGLGGSVMRGLGAWDYVAQPVLYAIWTRILPHLLDWMRRRGKARTRQEVGA